MQGNDCEATATRECAGTRVLDKLEQSAIRANDVACIVADRLTGVTSPEEAEISCSPPVPTYPYPRYFEQLDDLINRIDEALARIDGSMNRLELP